MNPPGYDPTTGESDEVSISTLSQGAAIEMVNEALTKVWHDIHDPNTKAEVKRAVTLVVEISPDESRQFVDIALRCDAKLARTKPSVTRVELGRMSGGRICAVELRSRQLPLDHIDTQGDVADINKAREARENGGQP